MYTVFTYVYASVLILPVNSVYFPADETITITWSAKDEQALREVTATCARLFPVCVGLKLQELSPFSELQNTSNLSRSLIMNTLFASMS